MTSTKNVELPTTLVMSLTIIGSLNQFSAKANLTTFIGEEKENEMHLLSLPRPLRIHVYTKR